jgi:hypothetical protein
MISYYKISRSSQDCIIAVKWAKTQIVARYVQVIEEVEGGMLRLSVSGFRRL